MTEHMEPRVWVLDDDVTLSVRDLCRSCTVHAELIIELVDEGILEPAGASVREWRFSADTIGRLRTALRLHHELRINFPGVALALDLLEENRSLRRRIGILE